MQEIYTPTKARQNLFNILKEVNQNSRPIIITKANGDESTAGVLVSKRDWDAQQETMALLANGQLQFALAHENDETEDLDDMLSSIDTEISQEND
ncbi:type II toxin-antitoxin system Phd/YefM family antitoxin [Lapidilactobacillus mulanensis]|uniref:Antitoxin n=1 Tax=Lapidilactobacillus mulanensis TaxID=2485999 RepID=A0ABW4DN55_9LACO|nr:type II toxin-antitoxin system Phd/YefM family antitoxin [Lapidilactobacillus mulanensis]